MPARIGFESLRTLLGIARRCIVLARRVSNAPGLSRALKPVDMSHEKPTIATIIGMMSNSNNRVKNAFTS
jgi:hypothetical protein